MRAMWKRVLPTFRTSLSTRQLGMENGKKAFNYSLKKQRNRGLSPIISLDHLLQPFADFDGVPVGGGVENENVGHVKANIDG